MNDTNNPALTYTLSEFISLGMQDEMTYRNFSIISYRMNTEFVDQNILDYYIKELKSVCMKITEFTNEEIKRYMYSPDLLAYDVYGSTQLDFIILLCNGMIDPKEFLSKVYNSETDWMNLNRSELDEAKS